MIKLTRQLCLFFLKFISVIFIYSHRLLNFSLPNLLKIVKHKIELKGNYPTCNQFTKITGLGIVIFGNNCTFGYKPGGFHKGGSIEFQPRYKNAKIIFGNNIATNNNIFISAINHIEIGDNTLIGQYVTIMDYEAHDSHPSRRGQMGRIGSVIIGRNVWIGNNVVILKDSIIGDNTIVATGAVVSGKFQEDLIIGGVPAKIIKDCGALWKLEMANSNEK